MGSHEEKIAQLLQVDIVYQSCVNIDIIWLLFLVLADLSDKKTEKMLNKWLRAQLFKMILKLKSDLFLLKVNLEPKSIRERETYKSEIPCEIVCDLYHSTWGN